MNTAIKSFVLVMIGNLNLVAAAGPYAPAAGQVGSTAISRDDPNIIAWADNWCDYIAGAYVDTQWQTPEKALGAAEGTSYDIV
ncbi:MAG: PEP-CTERM sorting domain-containing protein, partial [Planctomycetota bacterium]